MRQKRWLNVNEAALYLSTRLGRTVVPEYINRLAQFNRIKSKKTDGRTRMYDRLSLDIVTIRPYTRKEVTQ